MIVRTSITVLLGSALLAVSLGGCGSGTNQSAGISTASLLDGKAAAGTPDAGGLAAIKPDDPAARAVQVAWTAARAQKCGYNFDAGKLKANYLASEAQAGAQPAQISTFDKTYDQTLVTVAANIKGDEEYCTGRRTAGIKADLQRHLAGNYQPNLPKQQASAGIFDFLKGEVVEEKWDSKNFWADQQARKDGAKGAQRTGD